jgi:hypothetical protein
MATPTTTRDLKIVCKTILLNSRERDFEKYPSSNSYVIDLPRTYHNVVGAHLVSSEIPSSFHVFAAALGNTSMSVDVSGTTRSITIPDGNYGFSSMAAAIEQALNAAFVGETYQFEVSVSPVTGKLTIRCTNFPASTTLGIDTTDAPATKPVEWGLAYFLGFPKGVVTFGTFNSGSVTALSMALLNPYTYLILDIPELNGTDHVGVTGGNSVFGKIPLTVNSFNFVFCDKVLSKQTFSPPRLQLSRLRVSFRFPDGHPVDFQGMEHSFTIELTCTEEKIATRSY